MGNEDYNSDPLSPEDNRRVRQMLNEWEEGRPFYRAQASIYVHWKPILFIIGGIGIVVAAQNMGLIR